MAGQCDLVLARPNPCLLGKQRGVLRQGQREQALKVLGGRASRPAQDTQPKAENDRWKEAHEEKPQGNSRLTEDEDS
jgi:hypothetical protein